MFRLSKLCCVIGLCLCILGCAAAPGSESTGEFLDSTTTTAKVKTNLVNDLGSSGFSIQVKTFKDEVQLSGFVSTGRLKQRAGASAASTQGVNRVINDIIVKP